MMEIVKNFILEYRAIVAVAIIVIIFAIFKWQNFKKLAYNLMIVAEKDAQTYLLNAGKDKEDWVVRNLYIALPKVVAFVPDAVMHRIVHFLFVKGKDIVDNGKLDNSYVDTEEQ